MAKSTPPSDDGSTPKPQTAENLNPDTASHPSASDLAAAKDDGKTQAPDPLLNNAPGKLDPQDAVPGTDPSVVEMVTVKTTGAFMLMDPWTGKHFEQENGVETPKTEFVSRKLDSKELIEA